MTKVIAYQAEAGVSIVIPTPEAVDLIGIDEIAKKDVPAGATFQILDAEALPDRTFRAAWKMTGKKVATDLPKAREIAHERRRAKREAEFAPYDEIIAKQIPNDIDAEACRELIRIKYEEMQTAIDAATDTVALKNILSDC